MNPNIVIRNETHSAISIKYNFHPALTLCLLTVLLFCGCKDREEYKKEIIQKEMDYSVGSFLNEAGAGNLERVKLFLKAGMDINARGTNNETALMLAVTNSNIEMAKLLIANKADVNAKNNEGYTAMMIVSTFGDLKAINILIDAGADINARSNSGETALMLASLNGRIEAVELLIKKGADINAKNNRGETALKHAFLNRRLSEILRKAGAKE